jgi:hypothetical protein
LDTDKRAKGGIGREIEKERERKTIKDKQLGGVEFYLSNEIKERRERTFDI